MENLAGCDYLARSCGDTLTCPAVVQGGAGQLIVVGRTIGRPDLCGEGETAVEIDSKLLLEAARKLMVQQGIEA
jgi:hypothetical protein